MPRSPALIPPVLARAAARFARQRVRRTQRRLPPGLWEQAATLARQFGVSRTAQALGLNFTRLRQLAQAPAPGGTLPASRPSPSFVEVLQPSGFAPAQGVVEFERRDGTRARIRFPDGNWEDGVCLALRLWETNPCSK